MRSHLEGRPAAERRRLVGCEKGWEAIRNSQEPPHLYRQCRLGRYSVVGAGATVCCVLHDTDMDRLTREPVRSVSSHQKLSEPSPGARSPVVLPRGWRCAFAGGTTRQTTSA